MPEGGTRGMVTPPPSDTGGVAQHPLLPARIAPFSYENSTKNEIFFCYAKRLHNPFLTLHRQTKGRTSERLKAAHGSCGWSRKLPPLRNGEVAQLD